MMAQKPCMGLSGMNRSFLLSTTAAIFYEARSRLRFFSSFPLSFCKPSRRHALLTRRINIYPGNQCTGRYFLGGIQLQAGRDGELDKEIMGNWKDI